MISIILNSRGRVNRLKLLFWSILQNTIDLKNIEILIRIDHDDHETVNFFKILSTNNFNLFRIKCFIGPRPTNLCASYNELAKESKGDYIFVLNDDIDIITYGWDQEILSVPSNQIWLLSVFDTSIDKQNTINPLDNKYGSFVIHTRASYDALTYFMDERAKSLGGDTILWRLYKAIDRIKWINIMVDHVFHNTVEKVHNPDQTAIEYRKKFDIDPWTIDISNEINRMKSLL